MRINNNMLAINTHRQLGISNTAGAKSMEKLSSGFRINRAGDDAAGLAISEKMRGQIRGLTQASRNAQDGISLIQTTEGALNETHAILQRMRELAVQSATDTNTGVDRSNLQDEIDQLSEEITRIATTTQFNTMNLLDGSFEGKKFHIGANEGQDVTIKVNDMAAKALKVDGKEYTLAAISGLEVVGRDKDIKIAAVSGKTSGTITSAKMSGDVYVVTLGTEKTAKTIKATAGEVKSALEGLGLTVNYAEGKSGGSSVSKAVAAKSLGTGTAVSGKGINISSQSAASKSITIVNSALETVSKERSKLGAIQNRLEHTIKNLDTSAENLQASESRIRDVDMAKEMMEQTKQNILQQASTAMLAQANQAPQTVLQLLR
ncbi:flagellin [Tissierella praeacuta DSM 18095]|uniref:Flagellin n=1 Tax=Tissierella praeacuta DSM 18095 TaxID=1123404 RepID=A0A1M4X2I6_9FIRM|nr:flagellin [Tissierella praeacuta]SHE87422.1 flagellin [Tissierella praeacuta DSM 18095]SUO99636.1 Flagellin D [Tissierella praeacuta]